jgi:PKD repeat protein
VMLTVTDNEGLTNTVTHPVTATANQAPVAAFTASTTELVASVDASTSSDPDGTIASYSWKFGDGATGTGKTTTHAYATSGTYPVELTVTDNGGATGTVTKSVTVTGPLAKDSFGRTLATGLGSADIGGPWTLVGAASSFAVDGTSGIWKNTGAGKGAGASLTGVSSTDTDLQLRMSFDKAPTGGGYFGYFAARGTVNDAYRTKVFISSTGQVTLSLTKVVAGAETTLATKVLTGVTYQANAVYSIRTQAWGTNPTSLRAKMWLAGTAEPSTWAVTASDTTTSLQGAGGIAISSYLSATATNPPVWLRVSALVARPTGN